MRKKSLQYYNRRWKEGVTKGKKETVMWETELGAIKLPSLGTGD
jgi:hypothetical protein